jgi:hypothetical protein
MSILFDFCAKGKLSPQTPVNPSPKLSLHSKSKVKFGYNEQILKSNKSFKYTDIPSYNEQNDLSRAVRYTRV